MTKKRISAKSSPIIKYMSKPEEIKMNNNKKSDADKNQYDTPNKTSTERNNAHRSPIGDKPAKRPNNEGISPRVSNTSAGSKEAINEELTATINIILITHVLKSENLCKESRSHH